MAMLTVRNRETGFLQYELPIPPGTQVKDHSVYKNIKDKPNLIFIINEGKKDAFVYQENKPQPDKPIMLKWYETAVEVSQKVNTNYTELHHRKAAMIAVHEILEKELGKLEIWPKPVQTDFKALLNMVASGKDPLNELKGQTA